jgi:hypothetical protein
MATKTMPAKDSRAPRIGGTADIASLSAYGVARSTVKGTPLSAEELRISNRRKYATSTVRGDFRRNRH